MKLSRFGRENSEMIRKEVELFIPINTKRSKTMIWKQFLEFCEEKKYTIETGLSKS